MENITRYTTDFLNADVHESPRRTKLTQNRRWTMAKGWRAFKAGTGSVPAGPPFGGPVPRLGAIPGAAVEDDRVSRGDPGRGGESRR